MKKCMLYLALMCQIQNTHGLDYKPLVSLVKEYKKAILNKNRLISFIQDPNENKYVVKQYTYDIWKAKIATSVCEIVALEVADTLGVLHNKACLIPAGFSFIGKKTVVPATLHTHAPGILFAYYRGEQYKGLNIMQRTRRHDEITGLSRETIYHMSRHKDLPAMVAFDTFVGNFDRTSSNFFYDQITDSFCGIDVAPAFCEDLSPLITKTIQDFLTDESLRFNKAELQAIKKYIETLQQLINQNNPQKLCAKIEEYAKLAGFFEDSFFDKEVQNSCITYFAWCQKTIKSSYKNIPNIIKLFNELLQKHAAKL